MGKSTYVCERHSIAEEPTRPKVIGSFRVAPSLPATAANREALLGNALLTLHFHGAQHAQPAGMV